MVDDVVEVEVLDEPRGLRTAEVAVGVAAAALTGAVLGDGPMPSMLGISPAAIAAAMASDAVRGADVAEAGAADTAGLEVTRIWLAAEFWPALAVPNFSGPEAAVAFAALPVRAVDNCWEKEFVVPFVVDDCTVRLASGSIAAVLWVAETMLVLPPR